MSGTKSRLTALEARKRLLLIESEVNRVKLLREWQCLEAETSKLAHRAYSIFATVNSVAAWGIAGFKTLRELQGDRSRRKSSWVTKLLEGLRLGTSLWNSFRSPRS